MTRPDWINIIQDGVLYHIGFNPKGLLIQVDLTKESKKHGAPMKRVQVWRRGGGEKPLSERTSEAIERAIRLRERAVWNAEEGTWDYPGKV